MHSSARCFRLDHVLRADDLLVLLEVARSGTLIGAAASLGMDHTTISRRISALEAAVGARVMIRSARGCELTELGRSLLAASETVEHAVGQVRTLAQPGGVSELSGLVRISAPDAFAAEFVGPAMARMVRTHPRVSVELISATRPMVQGHGADIEIGLGSSLPRWETVLLSEYRLGLYASSDYLGDHGSPATMAELTGHQLVYYVESLLRVPELDVFDRLFPGFEVRVGSTSVHAQLAATVAGAGIGLLPTYLADPQVSLRRVLRAEVDVSQRYIAGLAPRALRRPATTVMMQELRAEVRARQHELLGRGAPPG
ncbi:LysR family transcriptional regulator [Nakamurella aerolata]|uniref:LysR family transcriptional regulator n=1 Tax=Nakamurella aerolata TaxID=1656892 RepID=UPI001BB0F52D|nr:LysR family transcriptional regulator [Nakamurella aerolata]